MSSLSKGVDAVLEATVVGSFSRVGYNWRSRLDHWQPPGPPRCLAGRTVLVTGATSGIGLAAAVQFAQLGASVGFLARDQARAEQARHEIQKAASGNAEVSFDLTDVSDFDALRGFATRFAEANSRLDVLVHNAGVLSADFRQAADGTELTVAAQVLGPFLLTGLLLPLLRQSAPARVITVSSGGMYTQRFDLAAVETDRHHYNGTAAYARAKRAQVVLNREWARRVASDQVAFQAMHPGWVDTPGIASSLPTFHRLMRPLLRTPGQGADTVVWLASDPAPLASSGELWHDRRRRGEHRLPWTRGDDDSHQLWEWCAERTGWDLP
jgi:NAD(P)-dependent dehydrogenase (short-subunit alcohol dehydrogenase family)